MAAAIAVDPAGNVYVTGSTTSLDFPVTKGAYASTGTSFLFKLNPDGSVGYSTYFTGASPNSVAVDAAGSAYLAGSSRGNLPVTPGAYQSVCNCSPISTGFLAIILESGFVTKFDPTASSLIYSTYFQTAELESPLNTLALASDGSPYIGGINGIYRLNAAGSAVLASLPPTIAASGDGYRTGREPLRRGRSVDGKQSISRPRPVRSNPLPLVRRRCPVKPGPFPASAIVKDGRADSRACWPQRYFGGPYDLIGVMTLDSAGNAYVGGTPRPYGLPTRTPLQGGFAATTGFLSELSGDLSTLLFSSYFGDTEHFTVQGVGADPDGTIRIGGATGQAFNSGAGPMNIWVNSLAPAPPPVLRIDAVENAASLVDGPISSGETIVVCGAGFGGERSYLIGGAAVPAISSPRPRLPRLFLKVSGPSKCSRRRSRFM